MRHPSGVFSLLLVHTLERFGFWGMRSLLVLFLIESASNGGFSWSESEAVAFCGFYAGILYITPPIGGRLADRWLGPLVSVLLGSILMASGIFALTFGIERILGPSLILVALGNGLFKPCVTSLLGKLYGPNHPMREKGYSYLYTSVLIGVLASAFVCGWLMPAFGFTVAFSVAGIGSLLAGLLFLALPRHYWYPTELQPAAQGQKPLTPADRRNIRMILMLVLFSIVFFAAHVQGGGLLTIFVHRYMDRHIGGWLVPTVWLTSCGTIIGIFFSPFLGAIWHKLGEQGREPSFFTKFSLGITATGLSFVIMMAAGLQGQYSPTHLSSIFWLMGYHLFYIGGKVLVIPILWSTVEKLSPERYRFCMMGIILGSISIGHLVGGQIGALIRGFETSTVFGILAMMCFVTAGIILFGARKSAMPYEGKTYGNT